MEEELEKFDVCGEINGYEFVKRCSNDDLKTLSDKDVPRLGAFYMHTAICASCRDSVAVALEEYAMGNKEFDENRFHKNMTYLEKRTLDY